LSINDSHVRICHRLNDGDSIWPPRNPAYDYCSSGAPARAHPAPLEMDAAGRACRGNSVAARYSTGHATCSQRGAEVVSSIDREL